jgi:serine/threonine protein kinase
VRLYFRAVRAQTLYNSPQREAHTDMGVMNDLSGTTLGAYQLLELLGRGGMATVYRAYQINVGREVAMKILSPDLAEEPEFISRFQHEAQLAAGLQHPNIVAVHDFGRVGPYSYLVMRLMEGGSLDRLLSGGRLSTDRVIQLTGQIASALDYAHGRGIVHRDLKPTNVLLDISGNAALTDFGIAKLMVGDQITGLTAAGTVMGTPTYMAPEQWRSEPVDARTDIYALGVIVFQMLAGRVPFASETPHGLMYQHLDAPPPPLRAIRPDLPLAVEPVIRKALAKNRQDRPISAGELARDLENALRFPAAAAYTPLPPRPATPPPMEPREAHPADRANDSPLILSRAEDRPFVPLSRGQTPPQPPVEVPPLVPYQPPRRPSAPDRHYEEPESGHATRFLGTLIAVAVGIGILLGIAVGIALLLSPNNSPQEPTLPFAPSGPTVIPDNLRPGIAIQSPDNNTVVDLGRSVTIRFIARGSQGITRVELQRFGQTINVANAGGQTTFSGWFDYVAASTGTHQLEIVPWSGDIPGTPATLTLIVR